MRVLASTAIVLIAGGIAAAEPPPYLPDNTATPGVANRKVTQGNIQKTICSARWVQSQRPSANYLGKEKSRQLAKLNYTATGAAAGDCKSPARSWRDQLP